MYSMNHIIIMIVPFIIINIYRSTVMLVLRQIDPASVRERARHRIIRRVYTSRVSIHVIIRYSGSDIK